MNSVGRQTSVALLGLGLLMLSTAAGAQNRTAVILSTASVGGETITCGCQKKELGGLARRATFIKTQRAKNPATVLVDAGDFGSHVDYEPWLRTEFQIDHKAQGNFPALPANEHSARGLVVPRHCRQNVRTRRHGRDAVILPRRGWRIGHALGLHPQDAGAVLRGGEYNC